MWVIHVTSHHLPLIIPCLVINPTTPFASCSEFHVPLVCVFSNSLQQLHKRETGSVPPPCVVQWVWGGGKCGGLKRSIFEIGNWDPFAHLRKPRFQNHIFDNGVVLGMCQGVHIQEGFGCINLVFKLLQGLKRSSWETCEGFGLWIDILAATKWQLIWVQGCPRKHLFLGWRHGN